MRQVIFTRESDGEQFTFSGEFPPYMLTHKTQLPSPRTLDVSGDEYSGVSGGYTLASRFQRMAVKIGYNVRESWNDPRSFLSLVTDASRFFLPMDDTLQVEKFSMQVDLDDSASSSFMMRHGAITVPFSAPAYGLSGVSMDNDMSFIFDDPNMYWVGGEGVVTGKILPTSLPGTKIGERWVNGGQVWNEGLSVWDYPKDGGGGTPQTINVVSAVSVGVEVNIFGKISNPKIINSVNGSSWSWKGTIPDGNVIHVSDDGISTDFTGNRLYNTIGGLIARPGLNTFELTGGDLSENAYAQVKVRGAF